MPRSDLRRRLLVVAVAIVVLAGAGAAYAFTRDDGDGRTGDEFDGRALDETVWQSCYPWQPDRCTNEWNEELEAYTADNVEVADGELRLVARAEPTKAVLFDGGEREVPYTSGLVRTRGSFRYGYVEVRAKVPAGRGLWPALWLYPADDDWPPEIDLLEVIGHEPDVLHMAVHQQDGPTQTFDHRGPDLSKDFHVYALDWQPDRLRFLLDGVEVASTTKAVPHEPMYLIANLAVGGKWPGPPDDETRFPATFRIDHVRIWPGATEPPGDAYRPEDAGR